MPRLGGLQGSCAAVFARSAADTRSPAPSSFSAHRLEALILRVDRGQFLTLVLPARFQQAGGLRCLLAQRLDLLLPQQVGQQRLDLSVAIGAELALALGWRTPR